MIEYISIFIISCLVIAKAGERLVKTLVNLSRILKWREFVVASILMAIGSSLPELFVGITSAISHKPQLAFGNVVGSNIIALTLLIAIGTFLLGSIKFEKRLLQRSSIFASFYAILPLLLMLDGTISRIDGIALLVFFALYIREIFYEKSKFTKIFNKLELKEWQKLKLLLKELGLFFVSLLLLILSAEGVVFSATKIAENSNLTLAIIGILGVALGTSLPEIVFEYKSIRLGHKELFLGDAMGSIAVNSGLVLGITSLISPIKVFHLSLFYNSILFASLATLLFLLFARSKDEISRKEGGILFLVYCLFVLLELILESFA